MQLKVTTVATILSVTAGVIALGGFIVNKWKVASARENGRLKEEEEKIKQQNDRNDWVGTLRFPVGKFWNREQIVYSLFFSLLKYSLDSEPQVYRISSFLPETQRNDLDNLATRKIYDEFYIIGWNLENGTFNFRSVFDANETIFEGRITSINSRSLRVKYHSSIQVLGEKWKVMEVYFYKYRLLDSTNYTLERLQNFERKLSINESHLALSELFYPTKISAQKFDEILGTDLVNSIIRAKTDFDTYSPLPVVLRQLTFEYAN